MTGRREAGGRESARGNDRLQAETVLRIRLSRLSRQQPLFLSPVVHGREKPTLTAIPVFHPHPRGGAIRGLRTWPLPKGETQKRETSPNTVPVTSCPRRRGRRGRSISRSLHLRLSLGSPSPSRPPARPSPEGLSRKIGKTCSTADRPSGGHERPSGCTCGRTHFVPKKKKKSSFPGGEG